MSEETTEDMSRKYDTGPTIETVLERIDAQTKEMRADFSRTLTRWKSHAGMSG